MRIAAGLRTALLASPLLLAACGGSSSHGALPDFADLVERVSPSVVNISALPADPEPTETAAGSTDPHGPMPDWLKKFLEQHGGSVKPDDKGAPADSTPDPNAGSEEDAPDGGSAGEQSLGSGFVLSSDGYILTNHHVIKDAKEVVVTLSDRRQLPAQIVGSDERSDLALLKIDATGLPAVKLADVRKTRVGDWVLAIGSPFGFDYSVTAGIISAKGRNLDTEQYVPFIQTDAAVNPGNSGGPLFNLRGEVVGINSQIYSQTGGFMGVAFAIPIDVAAKVVKQLKENGKVTRGWLGISMQKIDRDLAKSFGMDKPEGALVQRVLPDSPAQQAGLRAGDIILGYNGEPVLNYRTIKPLVGDSLPGDTVTLDLLRDGKHITIKVEVGTLEEQDQPEGAADKSDQPKATPDLPKPKKSQFPLGLNVQTLSDEERRAAKVVSGGAKVTEVAAGPGREAGLLPGDVILSIAGQEIDSAERYAQVVERLTPGRTVPMLIQRQPVGPLFLALNVPPKE
jgi:serine protease Do